jgi:diadenosine tetraphosphate (Ap4A) HIT family hydrolase
VDNDSSSCPFCHRIDGDDILTSTNMGVAFPDAYPLSPGHALVVPRRHVADLFELSSYEFEAIWHLVREVRGLIAEERKPAGFNVGVNIGEAAGQTVQHAHIHVIPRYAGDVENPRGGVRWVLPERAPYPAEE